MDPSWWSKVILISGLDIGYVIKGLFGNFLYITNRGVRSSGEAVRGDVFLPRNVGRLVSEQESFDLLVLESRIINCSKLLFPRMLSNGL